ncbi:MAG: RHS repeat domain-containing protein [Myxococcota bacterium]
MNGAAILGRVRWPHVLFLSGLVAALAFACVPAQLAPRPGLVELSELARVAVPGGHVNAAGGNYFHERVDLALDTRLGPFAIGAVYNSAWGWTASVDASYRNGALRDATGASIPLASVADGAAAPGTRWVKLDATRVKTKGGLVHEFDAATGRLLAIHYASASYPRLRFVQSQLGAQWRATAVEQCTSATACAPVFTLGYDASARLVRVDDRAGRTALFGYDSAGKLVSARDGLDVANGWPGERYAYAGNALSAITNSEGERLEIVSDSVARATQVRSIGAGDPTWRFAYGVGNPAGLYATTVTDPLGHVSSYVIDASCRVQSIVNALGERTDFTWSGLRPASRTLPDGTRTAWTWLDNDLASETLPSGNVRGFAYRTEGVDRERPDARPLLELRDSLGLIEQRSYDANGRLTGITNGASESTRIAYDAGEAIAQITHPGGSAVYFEQVGEHGHAERVSLDRSAWTTLAFDAVGNPTRMPRPAPYSGGVVGLGWDADRNLAALELRDAPAAPGSPTAALVTLSYRSDHQVARVLRPYGGETVFARDALGRLRELRERVSPGAAAANAWSVTRFSADSLGRTTAGERANGMRTERTYDAAGRVVQMRTLRGGVVENDVRFEYALGRLVRAYSAAGDFEELLAYDTAGRPSSVRHTLGESTRFGYDARGRTGSTTFVLPGGASLLELTAGYDGADREISVAALGTTLVDRSYLDGRLSRSAYANGVFAVSARLAGYGIESARDLWRGTTRIARCDFAIATTLSGELTGESCAVSSSGALNGASSQAFAYAAADSPPGADRRVVRALSAGGYEEQLSYDQLSSLSAVATFVDSAFGTIPSSREVSFNAEHNRALATTSTELVPIRWSHSYDDAGFETSRTQSSPLAPASTVAFTWTAAGDIASITTDGVVDATFAYDALGRRRALTANGRTLRWRFGGVVEADANDRPIAIDRGEVRIALDGAHRFRHPDARGNPRFVSNMNGDLERVARYSAFGERSARGVSDAFGFARGTHVATRSGELVWLGPRLLDPRSARFLSPDPIWNPLNAFSYTLGNPVDFWDVSGLHPGHAGGIDQHRQIAIAEITRDTLVALAANATGLAYVLPSPATIAAAIAAAVSALGAQRLLATLEKFHQLEFPVANPGFDLPPRLSDSNGFVFPSCFGPGCYGRPVVRICDDPDQCPF